MGRERLGERMDEKVKSVKSIQERVDVHIDGTIAGKKLCTEDRDFSSSKKSLGIEDALKVFLGRRVRCKL